jgi:hypothetical protein
MAYLERASINFYIIASFPQYDRRHFSKTVCFFDRAEFRVILYRVKAEIFMMFS